MPLTMVVFPTPGPPVMTNTLDISASRIAATWLSASARPIRPSTQGKALSGSIQGQGSVATCQSREPLGDGALRSMQARQKNTRRFAYPVSDHRALMQLEIERSSDELLRDFEQLFGKRDQLFGRQAAMSLIHGLSQRIRNPGADPHYGRLLDAELHGDRVGGLEADAADVARQAIGVFGHDLDGVRAVGLVDAHRPRRANTVAVQEHHDFPHRLLLGPGSGDAAGSHRPDAIDLTQPVRRRLDNVEHLLTEGAQEFSSVGRANAPDHAGREVLLDTVDRSRRRCPQETRIKL